MRDYQTTWEGEIEVGMIDAKGDNYFVRVPQGTLGVDFNGTWEVTTEWWGIDEYGRHESGRHDAIRNINPYVNPHIRYIRVNNEMVYERTDMAMKNEKTHAYQILEQQKRHLTSMVEQLRSNRDEMEKALEKTHKDLRTNSDKLSNVLETLRVLEDTGLQFWAEEEEDI